MPQSLDAEFVVGIIILLLVFGLTIMVSYKDDELLPTAHPQGFGSRMSQALIAVVAFVILAYMVRWLIVLLGPYLYWLLGAAVRPVEDIIRYIVSLLF